MNKILSQLLGTQSLWAGTDESFLQAQFALEKLVEHPKFKASTTEDEDEPSEDKEEELGYELTDKGVALVEIKGPLLNINAPAWLCKIYGLTAYPNIQSALHHASTNPDVKSIVLDVDSGGGHVSGIYETSEAVNKAKALKPVNTYANESMYSAAYWLGSQGSSISMSPNGGAGSIGVIAVHVETKKMYEDMGLKPTIFRSGEFKALGHPLEELTEEAKASIQEGMDFAYNNFLRVVAEGRGVTPEFAKETMAEGKVFYGMKAKDFNLVDEIESFDAFLDRWESPVAEQRGVTFGGQSAMEGVSMTLEELQAKVEELQGTLEAKETALSESQAEVENLKTTNAGLASQVEVLTAEVVQGKDLKAELSTMLDASINHMAVALNAKVIVPEDIVGKTAMQQQLKAEFETKFPSGGVAATGAEANETVEAALPAWYKRMKLNK